MVAVHDHWPFLTLRLHVRLIVLTVVCCQFGIWQNTLGKDEFLGDGAGCEKPTHVGEV